MVIPHTSTVTRGLVDGPARSKPKLKESTLPDEVSTTTTEAVKTASDGSVKIAVEKYNELLETINSQRNSITTIQTQLNRLRAEPPVINRTVVEKTAEMAAQDNRMLGGTLMGLGASMLVVGVFRFKAGSSPQ